MMLPADIRLAAESAEFPMKFSTEYPDFIPPWPQRLNSP